MKTKNISKIILIILLSQFFISIQISNVNADSEIIYTTIHTEINFQMESSTPCYLSIHIVFDLEEILGSSEITNISFIDYLFTEMFVYTIPINSYLVCNVYKGNIDSYDLISGWRCNSSINPIPIWENSRILDSCGFTLNSDNQLVGNSMYIRSSITITELTIFTMDFSLEISYQIDSYLAETEFMESVISLIPIIIILFFLPSIAYMQFGKSGFIIMLILSSIIAFMSDLVNLQTFIILLISDVIISLIAYKKLNYEGKYQNVQ